MNASSFVFDESGNEFSDVSLEHFHGGFDGRLYFGLLREGKVPPVISIGSRFLAFNSNIFKADEFSLSGVNLVQLSGGDGDASRFDPWPSSYMLEEWENKRGRFFIEPVLQGDRIPNSLDAFRLLGWGGAFNIIISEKFKGKLLFYDFDSSFLDFKKLVVR